MAMTNVVGYENYLYRNYGTDEEERNDPARVTGTVECVSGIGDSAFVRDDRDGKFYWFDNAIAKNPFRGIGSQERTYVIGVDDPEKKKPFMMLMNTDSNACNDECVGSVFAHGHKVTFVPKRAEELMRDEQGFILLYAQGANDQKPRVFPLPVGTPPSNSWLNHGLACDVALDSRIQQEHKRTVPVL